MDFSEVIIRILNWLWVPLTGAIGWFFKRIENRLDMIHQSAKNAEEKANALQLEIARYYVTRREHMEAVHRIDTKLDRILDKLDRKADK